MKRTLLLTSSEYTQLALRSISVGDLENLRQWKNANRQYFFYKGIISPEDQRRWFEGYLLREHDHMFIVAAQGVDIGCMAFRQMEKGGDIYNVILGPPEFGGHGWMAKAFHIMCSYAIDKYPTRLAAKVLCDNPALEWYCRNGFQRVADFPDYVEIVLDRAQYKNCSVIES
jgi:ribosomal protein S18 acetylase RimI-like enzyme